jgi:serine/threonine protein kinase
MCSRGIFRYIDPQYVLREELTTASDVYSYGMVLLELFSGQKAVDNMRSEDRNLIEWVRKYE